MSLLENTSKLREILDEVNSLPESGGGSDNENVFLYATGISSMFYGAAFPSGYELIINMPNFEINMASALARATNIKSFKIISQKDIGTNLHDMYESFSECRVIEFIDLSKINNGLIKPANNRFSMTFRRCDKLKEVKGVFDLSELKGQPYASFQECYALEEIRFLPNTIKYGLDMGYCKLLSNDSSQSIIDGLADLTDATSQTISLHADVKAKLTTEQIATITGKNWTLA